MRHFKRDLHFVRSVWFVLCLLPLLAQAADPLPAWREGPSRTSILAFVKDVTTEGGPRYVAPAERIAVFDNDGTLWSEQPMYFELLFALDEVKRLAPQHPQWRKEQPFKAVLENDQQALAAQGMDGLLKIVAATHSGMSTQQFSAVAREWLASARHPRSGRPYTEMVFQPMLELLGYLRANGFKTYIVSGGEVAFMRAFAEEVYGIPPEQVIGTTLGAKFEDQVGTLSIQRLPNIQHNDDGPGKPVSIDAVIGRRPILAFGNSDGDLQMLQWTMAGQGARFAGLVHHTDQRREWAYDRKSHFGRLDKALDQAQTQGWTVVDMAREWRRVYPFDSQ
ncbi:HAD family hydrolase [Pseudomonas kermanshahensis]|uniref:HAD family hydrolase n=1 Tax=Pseudomonas kermanshahensis TaxID=2745482 RepID=UPI0023DB242A|nr:HAD family hydrolase [Pseudomonas kermanshahensis]WEL57729.1 HAD family hydrolase [Pseudomonas kermanshahensis]